MDLKHLLRSTMIVSIFALAFLSGFLPRPLDYNLLVLSIALAGIFFFKSYFRALSNLIRLELMLPLFFVLLGVLVLTHGYDVVVGFFGEDGIFYTLFAFLHFSGLMGSMQPNEKRASLGVFYLIVSGMSLITLFQFFGVLATTSLSISDFYHSAPIYRSTGFLPHSTALTIWLVGINVFMFLFPLNSKRHAVIHTLTNFLSLSALAATMGRTGQLICLFVLLILLAKSALSSWRYQPNRNQIIKWATGVGLFIAFVTTVIVYSINTPGNRFADFMNVKAKHGQRLQENVLGLEILKQNPLGAGPEKIAAVALKIRSENSFFKNQNWIFTDWRGIHNGYLHYASLWGWTGLVLVSLCLLLPLFVRDLANKTVYLVSLGLALYFLTDNIFYREISTSFAFCFAATLLLPHQTSPSSVAKTTAIRWGYLIAATIFCFLVTNLVNLRLKQIDHAGAISLAIDNPKTQPVDVFVNETSVRRIEGNDYGILFFKSGVPIHVKAISENQNYSLNLNPLDTGRSYWTSSVSGQKYSLLFFKKNELTNLFEERSEAYTESNAFEVRPVPQSVLESNTIFNEESITDFKYLHLINKQPILVRNDFARESKYRCFEPFYFISEQNVYFDPCQADRRSVYSVLAFNYVFSHFRYKVRQFLK